MLKKWIIEKYPPVQTRVDFIKRIKHIQNEKERRSCGCMEWIHDNVK